MDWDRVEWYFHIKEQQSLVQITSLTIPDFLSKFVILLPQITDMAFGSLKIKTWYPINSRRLGLRSDLNTLKTLILLIILISISTFGTAQQLQTNDQLDVKKTLINFFEALSNRDSISLKNYCTDDILLFEYGQTWNLDTLIRKAIVRNTAKDFKRENTFDFITTSVKNKTAWATYNLHSEIVSDGKQITIHWMETIIAVKERKRWKIKVLHSTLIKRS